jgi:anti-sigma28 factor (negative regulator of flagellin synthesis)
VDTVEISDRAREAGSMQLVNEGAIRRDEVDRVRAEIARGEYLTAEKIEIAAERLARALDLRA